MSARTKAGRRARFREFTETVRVQRALDMAMREHDRGSNRRLRRLIARMDDDRFARILRGEFQHDDEADVGEAGAP